MQIDETEQNELNPQWLFRLIETANPQSVSVHEKEDVVTYVGSHSGYSRLADPVTHERCFSLYPASCELHIDDSLHGSGEHYLAWRFHVAPGVTIDLPAPGQARLDLGQAQYWLRFDHSLSAQTLASWYSPSYGVRLDTRALQLCSTVRLGGRLSFHFELSGTGPHGPSTDGAGRD